MARLDVFVNPPSSVQAAEGCEADGDAQELRGLHRSRQRFLADTATRIFEHQHLRPRCSEKASSRTAQAASRS